MTIEARNCYWDREGNQIIVIDKSKIAFHKGYAYHPGYPWPFNESHWELTIFPKK